MRPRVTTPMIVTIPRSEGCHYQNDMIKTKNVLDPCPIARSLASVGDRWSILILRDAHAGMTRFEQFRRSLNIAPTILTHRLSALISEGLLEKRRYSEHPPRDEYHLTAAGSDFLPILFMIGAWSQKHRSDDQMTRFYDAETGTEIEPVAIDEATGEKIGTRAIRVVRANL